MSGNYLIVDGNSLGNIAHNVRKLTLGEGPDAMQVQAIYNFVRTLRSFLGTHTGWTPIVVWDGQSWRKQALAGYKSSRAQDDRPSDAARLEARAHYEKQVPYIRKALRLLGVHQVWAANMEADDLAGILVARWRGRTVKLLSGDQDWYQLVEPGVTVHDLLKKVNVGTTNFAEITGFPSTKAYVEAMALSGDKSDDVPGVGGIGWAGAKDFFTRWPSYAAFLNEVTLMEPKSFKGLPKKFRDLIEDEEKAIRFQRNIDLVDLHTTARPKPDGMTVDQGKPDQEDFRRFCELLAFQSILQDLDDFLRVFPAYSHLT